MTWECIECEREYEDGTTGDAEERMCFNCLDGDDTVSNRFIMRCKSGKYEANSIWGLAWEILKHRTYHLFKHRKWMD